MKTSTKIICIVLIVSLLAMFGGVAFAAVKAIQVSEEQVQKMEALEDKVNDIIAEAEEKMAQAEQGRLNRQEQNQDLLGKLPERNPAPTLPEVPESPDLSHPGSAEHHFLDMAYERIIAMCKDRAEISELRVGESICPEGAAGLSENSCYVYTRNEDIVSVSEDCTITAVAPGKTYVLIGDEDNFLVYACVVTE